MLAWSRESAQPCNHELGVGINRSIRPNVSLTLLRGVFCFRTNERPILVRFNPLARNS